MTVGDDLPAEVDGGGSGVARRFGSADFVRGVTDTGGKVAIDVALYGRHNIGDVIGWSALMRFAALKVELGVEAFPVKQRGW